MPTRASGNAAPDRTSSWSLRWPAGRIGHMKAQAVVLCGTVLLAAACGSGSVHQFSGVSRTMRFGVVPLNVLTINPPGSQSPKVSRSEAEARLSRTTWGLPPSAHQVLSTTFALVTAGPVGIESQAG